MIEQHSNTSEPAAGAAFPETGEAPLPREETPAPQTGYNLSKFWREWARPFLIILVMVGSFRSAVADWNDVPTGSMIPSILAGDRIFVNKAAYSLRLPFSRWHLVEWSEPHRGDIVVFFSPDDGKRLVKRVVAVPGDRVELRDNRLLINGEPARYQPTDLPGVEIELADPDHLTRFVEERLQEVVHPIALSPHTPARRSFGPQTVPAGTYFVMGDNRDNSRDSRFFGFVARELIVGRAVAVAFSLDPRHGLRWQRLFLKLH